MSDQKHAVKITCTGDGDPLFTMIRERAWEHVEPNMSVARGPREDVIELVTDDVVLLETIVAGYLGSARIEATPLT